MAGCYLSIYIYLSICPIRNVVHLLR